ncbi:MAG: glycosyl transferase [Polyangiaceae bacterium UTPRO1]|jgi:glycosyltransferase involved in cell wall biosynthesis|nr:glycosyltransferase family 2 protein [Myxococcales bacterium]OQY68634.1 MAG: glycosyl transferase [Polyangiaceae bacterium UTPRO1]
MKLVIQIPCLNEEEALPHALAALPHQVRGFDEVEVIVIDDGSSDATADVALAHGVHEVVRFPNHQGLARAFAAGLDRALQRGADVIVNTDADNQYDARDIEALAQPILRGEADMVIGDRNPSRLEHFSFTKRVLQGLGSWAVRQLSGTSIPDATSGFRAVSRAAALKMNVLSDFTYTLETIIQAGKKQIAVTHVPVRTRPTERPSRLFSGASHYIRRSVATLLRMYAFYEPFKFFFLGGGILIAISTAIGARFLWYYFTEGGAGHIQSLILGGALLMIGAVTWLFGVLADLIGRNRQLSEEILMRMRRLELHVGAGSGTHRPPRRGDEAAPRRAADRRPR